MTQANSHFRAAVVQAGSILFDTPRTLDKLAELAAAAHAMGASLAVFPEAFIGGYPKGRQFGTSLGRRTAEGREEFRTYFENAIDVPGPETNFIGNVARDNQLYLVTGVIERSGGTLYCTVLFFSPAGELLGKHNQKSFNFPKLFESTAVGLFRSHCNESTDSLRFGSNERQKPSLGQRMPDV